MGSRQERSAESHIVQQTLDDPQLRTALQALANTADSARGPHGHVHSLQNNVGGPITMTTSSVRLLSALSVSRPCLRLIMSAVQGHLKNHNDGGLLAVSLCLHLVLNAVELENVGRVCVREVYDVCLHLVDVYLNAEDCPVTVSVDTSKVKVVLGYVQNIITTKPICCLRPPSASHISQLVLKAFLASVPDTPKSLLSDQVYVLQFDKTDVMSSEVIEGLLLEWPEQSAQFGQQELRVIREASGEVKVALVNVSMSGDAEETLTNRVEAQRHVVQSAAELIMMKLLAFCDWLVEKQVGVLLCQKVIHPKVKAYLRQRGLVFVERLGIQPMGYVQDLTGASPISSVLAIPPDSACGRLSDVTHRVVHAKSYLHLQKADGNVSSLLLCAPVDEQLAELKSVVQSAMTGLWHTFQRPYLLCGGGCWQVHLAFYLRHMAKTQCSDLCTQLSITNTQLLIIVNAFAASLEATARSLIDPAFCAWVDMQNWHVWHAPQGVDLTTEKSPFACACGMLTDKDIDRNTLHLLQERNSRHLWTSVDDREGYSMKKGCLEMKDSVNCDWLVLDTMDCVVSAVRTAVMTSSTVLSIAQFIHDVN